MSFLLSHAFTSYKAWDRIVVGTIPYELFNLHVVRESVTLQLNGTILR
jgi:hypothetical protein